MLASIVSSDFCREPRAIHGTISEVAGMPMPRTEGAMVDIVVAGLRVDELREKRRRT